MNSASIATIVRIPYADGILDNPDFLYTFTDLAIWSTLEIGIALTASSLATLTPLFRKVKFFSSSRGGDSGTPAPWQSSRAGRPRPSNGDHFTPHNFVEITAGGTVSSSNGNTRSKRNSNSNNNGGNNHRSRGGDIDGIAEDRSDSDIEMVPKASADSELGGRTFYEEV